MKRFLKWAGIGVLALLVVVGGFAAYVQITGIPTYDVQKVDLTVQSTPERVAHGKELASRLCMLCHMNPETKLLTGNRLEDMPAEFGAAYSRNITSHKTAGIGSWTDGEIAWLLRTGIHPKTGGYVPPWMPKFPHMSDEDLYSVIAWLRSDDPYLRASDVKNRESEPTWFAKFLTHVAFKPFDYPTSKIPHPDTTNTVVYGKYLATGVYDCYQCHSAAFETNDPLNPEKSEGFFGGGYKMPDLTGTEINVANLTSDKTHGIGRYTRDQFVSMMKTGFRPDGTNMRYPMARMATMSDHALGSVYDYLMTVPAIPNHVTNAKPSGPWKTEGARLWDLKGCSGCHGATGAGVANMRKANAKYPEDSTLQDVIQNQIRYNPDTFMPEYQGHLSANDLQALTSHIRSMK
ncbi:MAG: cytochrome c [Ignavibacteriae bacterium]|nr:MAG: cytochrome c [Ignavibacteriota bacterium]